MNNCLDAYEKKYKKYANKIKNLSQCGGKSKNSVSAIHYLPIQNPKDCPTFT